MKNREKCCNNLYQEFFLFYYFLRPKKESIPIEIFFQRPVFGTFTCFKSQRYRKTCLCKISPSIYLQCIIEKCMEFCIKLNKILCVFF